MFKLGQVVINPRQPKTKWIIVAASRTRVIIAKPGQTDFKRFTFIRPSFLEENGSWKLLDEFDKQTQNNYQDFQFAQDMQEIKMKRAIDAMNKGQIFISTDGKRYAFVEMKRTRFSCSLVKQDGDHEVADLEDGEYNGKPALIKEITQQFAIHKSSFNFG